MYEISEKTPSAALSRFHQRYPQFNVTPTAPDCFTTKYKGVRVYGTIIKSRDDHSRDRLKLKYLHRQLDKNPNLKVIVV